MIRSDFDTVALGIITEGLENIVSIIKTHAQEHNIPATEQDIRSIIEVSNKVALENL